MDLQNSQPHSAEMAHVLLMDIVGYSRLPMTRQREVLHRLQAAVQSTRDFVRARSRDQLISLPTGDGMALVFFRDPEAPVRCALDLGRVIRPLPELQLRMGLHTGPVYRVADINSNSNVSGSGINVAQRVMDCGDNGHILLSSAIADVLVQFGTWSEYMHDLGEAEVKHQVKVHLYNFYSNEFGNPAVPDKVKKQSAAREPAVAQVTPRDYRPAEETVPHDETIGGDAPTSLVGQTVTHYHVLRQIGAGGMGVVYEAEDIRLGRRVALKSLLDEHAHSSLESVRLQKEAKAVSSLSHPNICTIFDVGDFGGRYFMVMELLEGETLRELLTRGRVPAEKVVEIGIQVADALGYAHERGLIHRDIKPANIFLNKWGQVKILDFGLAQLIPNNLTITERFGATAPREMGMSEFSARVMPRRPEGTLIYMSPEQVRGQELDGRSDLFSVGIVLYEMCTQELPFPGQTVTAVEDAILHRTPTPITQLNREIPKELESVVSKALSKDRQSRYASASDLKLDLRKTYKPRVDVPPTIGTVGSDQLGEVVLLYKRNAQPDERLLKLLEDRLRASGYPIFVDRHLSVGIEWAREIEARIKNAFAIVILLSEASIHSEMLGHEIQIAHETAQKRSGKPRLLPVRINFRDRLPDGLSGVLDGIQYAEWSNSRDDEALISKILTSLRNENPPDPLPIQLEPVGGAVPLDAKFYIRRPTDDEFYEAVNRNDSIILVKGARQMGKTSLMARGLQKARESGAKIVLTDLQKLNAFHLESVDKLFMTLSQAFADQLDLEVTPEETWNPNRGPSMNFERFLRREVLGKVPSRVVWGIDEADRLFSYSFASEVFGLFRSWHNERSLSPDGPWRKLTLAICYATEAHMFITDMNQSPFNVGTRLVLADFSREDVEELNKRYGSPLKKTTELRLFYDLIAGQPYLTRRGLHELATAKLEFPAFVEQAARDEGPFGDHLRRILVSLTQDPKLCEVVKNLLAGRPSGASESFYRLRSSGIVSGDSVREMKPRCRLYQVYLTRHLL